MNEITHTFIAQFIIAPSADSNKNFVCRSGTNPMSGITIYSQAHKTEEDILCSVRHEARHAWQWKHYYDFCNWWKMNIAFYNLVQTIPFCNEYRWICTHESDAEEYALYGKSAWEKTLSTDILLLEKKAREIFQKIAPACAPSKASEYIRKNYCLLRLQGWLV